MIESLESRDGQNPLIRIKVDGLRKKLHSTVDPYLPAQLMIELSGRNKMSLMSSP